MDFKFSNDAKEPAPGVPAEKGRQNMLLVVLLVLVAAFAYLYFFTGLIKPQEAQKPAEAPTPQVVKKPLPPRDGQADKNVAATSPDKNATTPVTPGKVASSGAPAAAKEEPPKPTAPKAESTKPTASAKDAAPPVKKAAAPEVTGKKPAPAAKQQPNIAVKKSVQTRENTKKPTETAKSPAKAQTGAATVAAKKTPPAAAKKEAVKPAPAGAGGPWTVVVGNYVLEDSMAKDLARIKGAGLEGVVKDVGRKKTAMNRLRAGDYQTRAEAMAELDKLKQYTSDAFMLEQGGTFSVYAGSYLAAARAVAEKERLASAGLKLTVQHTEVSIPSKSLTAGTFNDKKAADAALKKLKRLGFKATLAHP